MAMNKVSDVPLAVAVRKAGCLPSLSLYNCYVRVGIIDPNRLDRDIAQYANAVGDASILISVDSENLLDLQGLVDILLTRKVKAVEIILNDPHVDALHRRSVILPQVIKKLQNNGTLVFTKTLLAEDVLEETDGFILKGPDGAGRGNLSGDTLEQLFDRYITNFPNQKFITSGGVSTNKQLRYYMDRGAFGVGIGTMFAVSTESKISTETKLKLVASGVDDIKRLNNGRTDSYSQNAIVFATTANDNDNNTHGLMTGIKSPNQGHVFIGKGIEHATEILTCEAIVQRLVSD